MMSAGNAGVHLAIKVVNRCSAYLPAVLLLCCCFNETPVSNAAATPAKSTAAAWVHIVEQVIAQPNQAAPAQQLHSEVHVNLVDGSIATVNESGAERRVQLVSAAKSEIAEFDSKLNRIRISLLPPDRLAELRAQAAKVPFTVPAFLAAYEYNEGAGGLTASAVEDGLERFEIESLAGKAKECDLCPELPGRLTLWAEPGSKRIRKIVNWTRPETPLVYSYGSPAIDAIFDLGVAPSTPLIDNRPSVEVQEIAARVERQFKQGLGDEAALLVELLVDADGARRPNMATIFARQGAAFLYATYSLRGKAAWIDGICSLNGWPAPDLNELLKLIDDVPPTFSFVTDGAAVWSGISDEPSAPDSGYRESQGSLHDLPPRPEYLVESCLWPMAKEVDLYDPDKMVKVQRDEKHDPAVGLLVDESEASPALDRALPSPESASPVLDSAPSAPDHRPGPDHASLRMVQRIFWFDPTRNDVATEQVERTVDKAGTKIVTEFRTQCLRFTQTADGTWYPAVWETTGSRDPGRRTEHKLVREYRLLIVPGMKIAPSWFSSPDNRLHKAP